MNTFFREAVIVAVAGATMLGLVVEKSAATGQAGAYAAIAVLAGAAGLVARGRRRKDAARI